MTYILVEQKHLPQEQTYRLLENLYKPLTLELTTFDLSIFPLNSLPVW